MVVQGRSGEAEMMKITRKIIWEGGEDVDVCDDGEGGGGGGGAWAAVEKKSQGCIKFRLEVWKASSLARSLGLLPLASSASNDLKTS